MSDGRHKALKQAVQRMLNSMENLSVDASGIARGSWVQAHLREVQDLLWEGPPMPAPAPTPANDKCESTGTFGASVNKLAHCQRCTMYQICLRASGEGRGVKVGLLDLSNLEVSVPAPEPKGFGLDAKIDNVMATMPKDWNGKFFFILIGRMVDTFISKNADYAGNDRVGADALANFKSSTEIEVAPIKGVLLRCQDKWKRIQNLTREARVGMVKDETIVDTMLDLANYLIIAVMVRMTSNDTEGE